MLRECVNTHNAIDFVDNTPLSVDGDSGLEAQILEGLPAFLESQGIRYVPVPLQSRPRIATPQEPMASSMTDHPYYAPLDLQTRVKSNVQRCMQLSSAPDDSFAPPRRLTRAPDDSFAPPRRLTRAPDDSFAPPRRLTSAPDDYSTPPRRLTRASDDSFAPPRHLTRASDDSFAPPRRQTRALDDSFAPPRRPTQPCRLQSQALHTEQASAQDNANTRLRALHAEIMATAPKGSRRQDTLSAPADWDDDEGLCNVSRPTRRALLHADW